MTGPIDNDIRKKIRTDFSSSFLVEASAGTGKTTCLVDRITNALLENIVKPREIAAITFTNKAADELRSRILLSLFDKQSAKNITQAEKENIQNIIESIGNCDISTIHSFYQRMLSERPLEADLDSEVRILEEEGNISENIWAGYMEEKIAGFNRYDDLFNSMEVLSVSIGSFKDFCFETVNYPDLELSGRAAGPVSWEDFMKTVLEMFGDFIKWIPESMEKCNAPENDAYCRDLKRIKKTWKNLKGSADEAKLTFLSQLKTTAQVKKDDKNNWDKDGAKNIGIREWEISKVKLKEINKLISDFLYNIALDLNGHFSKYFAEYKKIHSVITFVDALVKTRDILKNNKNVRNYFRNKYKMILVDEFQDTDPVQAEVIAILSSDDDNINNWRELNIVPGKLFVVGDPKQSIFRFRRADITIYEEFKELFKGDKKSILKLTQNFRSFKGITDPVNEYFKENLKEKEDNSSPGYELIDPYKGKGGGVTLLKMKLSADDDPKNIFQRKKRENSLRAPYLRAREQKLFARWLEEAIEKKKIKLKGRQAAGPGDIIILFRRGTYIGDWAKALEERNIPVENISGKKFYEREEVREALSLFRAVVVPTDTASVYGALKSPVFGLTDTEIFNIVNKAGSLNYQKIDPLVLSGDAKNAISELQRLKKESCDIPGRFLPDYIIKATGMLYLYSEILHRPGRAAALVKLCDIAQEISSKEGVDFYGVLERFSELREEKEKSLYLEEDCPAGVRLMTIHQAKGLEAPVVITGDMSAGGTKKRFITQFIDREAGRYYKTFVANRPESYENSKNFESLPDNWEEYKKTELEFSMQEDMRLRYVACTRASDRLIILFYEKLNNAAFYKDIAFFLENKYEAAEKVEVAYSDYKSDYKSDDRPGETEYPESEDIKTDNKGYNSYLRAREKQIKNFNKREYEKIIPSYIDDREGSRKYGYGAAHGNQAHKILQYKFNNPDKETDFNKYEQSNLLKKHINYAVNSSLWQKAAEAEEKYTEFPVLLCNDSENTIISGAIDLLFKDKDGKWVIVDYKTNKIKDNEALEALKEHYKPQMERYKKLFEDATGEEVKETKLLFLDL